MVEDELWIAVVETQVPAMEATAVVEDERFDPAILELALVAVEQSIVGLLVVVAAAVQLANHANHPVWVVTTVGPELADSNPVAVSAVAGLAIVVENKQHNKTFATSMLAANSIPVFLDHT